MTDQLQPIDTRLHIHGTHGRGRLRHATDERLVSALRRGDERAFEVIYDRYSGQLLGFCRHMLGSREEAEDALQHVFIAAHRHLLDRSRDVELKPWLYAIARNRCVSMLRARRPTAPLEPWDEPSTDGLAVAEEVERREGVAEMLADLVRLPEEQRAALLLAEVEDLSHKQIGQVLGVPPKRVKALIFQARTTLAGWRLARATDCAVIQEQLATVRGSALRRASLRRHVSVCPGCAAFEREVAHQRAAIALLLPVVPSAALKEGILGAAATGAAAAGGAAAGGGAAGGGVVAGAAGFAAKTLAVVVVAAGTGTGAVAVRDAVDHHPPARAKAADHPPAVRSAAPAAATMAPGHTTAAPALGAAKALGAGPSRARSTPPHRRERAGDPAKTPPGHVKSRPDHAKAAEQVATPPGRSDAAPGRLKAPSGKVKKLPAAPKLPPGQVKKAPKHSKKAPKPSSGQAKKAPAAPKTAPGQAKRAPAAPKTAPGQAKKAPAAPKTPSGQAKKAPAAPKTPSGQAKQAPAVPKTPPGQAKKPPEEPVTPSPEPAPAAGPPPNHGNGHGKP